MFYRKNFMFFLMSNTSVNYFDIILSAIACTKIAVHCLEKNSYKVLMNKIWILARLSVVSSLLAQTVRTKIIIQNTCVRKKQLLLICSYKRD